MKNLRLYEDYGKKFVEMENQKQGEWVDYYDDEIVGNYFDLMEKYEKDFIVGKRVKLKPEIERKKQKLYNHYFDGKSNSNPIDIGGTISYVEGSSITVKWDNNTHNGYHYVDLLIQKK